MKSKKIRFVLQDWPGICENIQKNSADIYESLKVFISYQMFKCQDSQREIEMLHPTRSLRLYAKEQAKNVCGDPKVNPDPTE